MSIAPQFGLLWISATDPTISPGVSAPLNQFCVCTDSGSLYFKSGVGDTAWTIVGRGGAPAPGVGDSFFGTGYDGDVTIAAPISLLRDTYYDNLTINAYGLSPQGYRVFVRNGLLLSGAGIRIGRNGNNGVDGTGAGTSPAGGAALALGSIASLGGSGGGAGGSQGGGVGASGSTSLNVPFGFALGAAAAGAAGGVGQGGGGGNNSVGGPPAAGLGGLTTQAPANTGAAMFNIFQATSWRALGDMVAPASNDWGFTGATGGGGGAGSSIAGRGAGGGGGGSSYPIFLAYRRLLAGSNGWIEALGGWGGDADQDATPDLGGGGGGASGNTVVIICGDGSTITVRNAWLGGIPGSKTAGAAGKGGPGTPTPLLSPYAGGNGGDGLTIRFRV